MTRMDIEHAEGLKTMMRYSTDPRWVERQLVNDYADPGEDIVKPSRIPWGIVITAIICIGFSLAMLGYAYASERERPHDLWLLVKPTATLAAAADAQRNQFKIGVGYQSKAKCEDKKREMRKVAGTLQCLSKGE